MPRPPRPPRPRGTLRYEKEALGLDALVSRLEERGLTIADRDRTRRYLKHIGYFRLSPYTIPFQSPGRDHLFRDGTSFDDVLDLYVFDRALRLLVMDALERLEVAVRAAVTDHMSTAYGDPHWYVQPVHFLDGRKHAGLLQIVHKSCDERLRGAPDAGEDALVHRSALEHYLTTYGEPELPPSWLMLEALTIGQLDSVIGNLKLRSDRSAIAANIGLNERVLTSWMRSYVRVRNICAHHGRLWNVGLGVYPAIPTSQTVSWLEAPGALPRRSEKRLYPVLISLQSILNTISPHSGWSRRLHDLLVTRPVMNLTGMGMPEGWAADTFWSDHLR